MRGRLRQIDVGADGTVFAIGTNQRGTVYDIYRLANDQWQRVSGNLAEIEVGPDGVPIGAGARNRMWLRNGTRWSLIREDVVDVAIDDLGTRYAALADGSIVVAREGGWTPVAPAPAMAGALTLSGVAVEAGPGGLVVVRDGDGHLVALTPFGIFALPGTVVTHSVGADGRLYAVLADSAFGTNAAVTWSMPFGWQYLGMNGARDVTAGPGGTVYVTLLNGIVQTRAFPILP